MKLVWYSLKLNAASAYYMWKQFVQNLVKMLFSLRQQEVSSHSPFTISTQINLKVNFLEVLLSLCWNLQSLEAKNDVLYVLWLKKSYHSPLPHFALFKRMQHMWQALTCSIYTHYLFMLITTKSALSIWIL